ncbi:MAG: hypothetical protein AAB592_04920, partial [Patescibacteria group bacterium]
GKGRKIGASMTKPKKFLELRARVRFIVEMLWKIAKFPENILTATEQSAATSINIEAVVNRIGETLPGAEYHNLSSKGEIAVFFAITGDGFGWYTLNPSDPLAWPVQVAESSDFQLVHRTAFSPDGKEMITISETGEIFTTDLDTSEKTNLGAFTEVSQYSGIEHGLYSFVVYTPDGKYIVFQNLWNSTLLVVDANTKNIKNGTVIAGFPISGSGGGESESGTDFSVFKFSDDGKKLIFEDEYILDLETLRKVE